MFVLITRVPFSTTIVNLSQSVRRFQATELVPTLLTETSALWNMKMQRLLLPLEHLSVQCVPIFDDSRLFDDRFAIERLALSRDLSDRAINQLAGNGMNLAAVGSAILFAMVSVAFHLPGSDM